MTAYLGAGNAANALWGAHTLVATPALDTLFPDAHLLSNRLEELVRWSTGAADVELVIDLNMFYDGSFELATAGQAPLSTDPKGRRAWQVEAATPTAATAVGSNPDGTGQELRLNASGEAVFYDVEVIAGNTYRLTGDFYGHGSSTAQVELINLDTNKYLNSSGGWNTAQTYVATEATTGWDSFAETFTVETQADGAPDRMTLRLRLSKSGANTNPVYFDDLVLIPAPNTVALIGARYGAGIDAELWSGTTSAGDTTNEVTLPRNGLRSFATFTAPATPRRYYRLLMDGGPSVRFIDFQQLWLFERVELEKSPIAPTMSHRMAQSRTGHRVTNRGRTPRLYQPLQWKVFGNSGLDQALERFYLGSAQGAEPCLLIPDITRADRVIHGRIADAEIEEAYHSPTGKGLTVDFLEDPMAGITT